MSLPSERFRGGDTRPIGFEAEPSASLIRRTIGVLEEVAEAITMPGGGRALNVCFTSVALMPGLPFQLYGFPLQEVDDAGRVVTDVAEHEIRYAFVANQPVDLQRESAISGLFQLLGRHDVVTKALTDQMPFSELPNRATVMDGESLKTASSELRGNWRDAVKSLQAAAAASGVALRVRYQTDPFPRHQDVVRRYGALRRAYNEIAPAREAVDRASGMLGAAPWQIVGGGDEKMRLQVQERLESLQISRFIAQAFRDGYVCGDGYVNVSGRDVPVRALRPETIEVRDGRFIEHSPMGERDITEGTIHCQGMRQLSSPYGVSLLELALPALRAHDHVQWQEQDASRFRRSGLTVSQIRQLEDQARLFAEIRDDTVERLAPVLGFFRERLPDPPRDLYFPGQERIS